MRRITCLCVSAFVLGTTVGFAQTLRHTHPHRQVAPSQSITSIVNRVSGLPPEYKADLGFTVIDASQNSLSLRRRLALIEDIFRSAADARHPYMVIEAAGYPHTDTLLHVTRNMLGRTKADTLDIQARAIDRALALAPPLATRLFEELRPAEVRASCSDAAVEDISAFYVTATKLIEDSRVKHIAREDKSVYVLNLASEMRVPAQVAPLANLISKVSLSKTQLGQVADAFVASFSQITASDREITALEEAEGGNDLATAMKSLSERLERSSISPMSLMAAYREFLVRSLTPEACGDHSVDRKEIAARFNALLPSATQESTVSPLSAYELKPKRTGDVAPFEIVPFDSQVMTKVNRIRLAHDALVAEEYRTGQSRNIEPDRSDVEDVLQYAVAPGVKDSKCDVCDFCAHAHLSSVITQNRPIVIT